MLFFYIRHGDPIYEPDSLTPLGQKQAKALAKRLSRSEIDRIYSSTSNRAIQTAQPTCKLTKKDMELLDFANEIHAWEELTLEKDGEKMWLFEDYETKMLLLDPSVTSLGFQWYEHPMLHRYKQGYDRIYNETSAFFKTLGYEHIKHTGKYRVLQSNEERVAFFAHHGFGIAFLSAVLDIPYPIVANHFCMCHTGVTVIDFKEYNGYVIPKMLMLSSDAHIYKEGLPTKYNNGLFF